ncbi:DUF3320 domain-containing protein [Mucilaginibacter sp. PAMB04168]|uniref:DUF3320 domain-containing protein n=1 Tax=Mucilaginibacter sp. PAMB04168 TaxID=3138567 RepID=UPI0031F6D80D
MNTTSHPKPEIVLDHSPAINFAFQQNHVPVIRSLTIKNNSGLHWENVKLNIESEPDFAAIWNGDISILHNGEEQVFKNIPIHISSKYLAELTERVSGKFILTVTAGNDVIFREHYRIELLAYDQWNGVAVLPEMLAAFITPNHPEIVKIIKNASELLKTWTGSPSFDEYQSRNPNRVRKQMAAIFEAIVAMDLVYCTVPASFEESGQRIRLADNIFHNRLANCLDLSLLYAACLEAVGIHPLIIIIKGHAFVGGWLIDESFADTVNDDPSLITKRTADGINDIVILEATSMNAGNHASFDDAVRSADQKMMRTEDFILFLDVKRARFSSIRPLPLRIPTPAGWEIVEEARLTKETALPEDIFIGEKLIHADKIAVSKQRLWERKLLDLTLRNSLLNVRITKSVIQFITINAGKLEDALADGTEFQVLAKPTDWSNNPRDTGVYEALHQSDPIADLVKNELSQRRLRTYLSDLELDYSLTSLYRSSRLSLEENGANTLYVGLGLLKWFETDLSERPRYAPILLLPVEIVRKSAQKGYVIRSREEETIMNITLLEMIRQDFGITIGGLETLPKDESGIDVKRVFNIIRQAIMTRSRWDVEEQALLGTFSFSKFILWNDIHNNADKLARNKVVASLISGKLEWQPDAEADAASIADDQLHPGAVSLPISSDSSQLQAIVSSGEGRSFVLHGPPGTGKSQTITNIIANALYSGKRVLFVAAKKAALDVVESRLESIGIGPFCLELHSNKSKKSAVLEQLKAATEVIRREPPEIYQAEAERLLNLRNELNVYVTALHEKYPFGFSLFELFTRYSRLPQSPDLVNFSADSLQALTAQQLTVWRDAVQELQAAGQLIGHPYGHPWQATRIAQYNLQLKQDIKVVLEDLLAQLNNSAEQTQKVSEVLKVGQLVRTREQETALAVLAEVFQQMEDLPASMLRTDSLEQTMARVVEIAAHGRKRDNIRADLLSRFQKESLTYPASGTLADWNIASGQWFLPRWFKQRALLKDVNRLSLSGGIEKDGVPGALQQIIQYQDEQEILAKAEWLPPVIGHLWRSGDADWDRVIKACEQVIQLNRAAGTIIGSAGLRGWRLQLADEFAEGSQAFISGHYKLLQAYVSSNRTLLQLQDRLASLLGINLSTPEEQGTDWKKMLFAAASEWLAHIDSLKDWFNWLTARQKALTNGLESLVAAYESGKVQTGDLTRQFEKGFYRSAAEYIIERNAQLATFNGSLFDEKVRRFREISKDFEELTKQELYARLASRIPSFTQEASQSSEIGMLQRNIRNNGRAMSIRKIFDAIPNLLQRLTPCMLMSPISVAQYFDANSAKFDLVVFDEASQMPTCEAVGAIARGTSVIVVGDPKQMPPTSFFATNNVDEENIDKEDLESILDDCLALSMPSHHLLWHYRSKHESLIAFSNAKYYENKLLTFPSTDDIVSKVQFVHVPGFYDKGKSRQNRFEAKAIVDEVVHRLSDPELAKRSIGIITFSSVQQVLVDDLLNDVFKLRPDLEKIALERDEPLFIKNLENVQGDERDIILFSIGYGPDEQSKVSLNFGPINREGGWRRLNVAVSRARYEMKVFSTLQADQINLNRTGSEGVAGLKAFLAYAEKGKTALPIRTSPENDPGDSFESLIAKVLREKGYNVHTHIGCSAYKIDIGVVDKDNPSGYILGIMTDGVNYYNAKTSRDREIVQVDVLKMLGWNMHKIYATAWWEKPDLVIDGIVTAIQHAEENKVSLPTAEVPKAVVQEAPIVLNRTYQPPVQREWASEPPVTAGVAYEICPIEIVLTSSNEDILLPQNRGKLKTQIFNVLEIEAPISKSLLSKRVLAAWGITRMGTRIAAHLDLLFEQLGMTPIPCTYNAFFWKKDQNPADYKQYRVAVNEAQKRDAGDLPPQEVANGVKLILQNQISLNREDLVRETAKLFGYARIGSNVENVMNAGINQAVELGFAIVQGERVVWRAS